MIYFFIGLGILLIGLITVIIIKLKELKEIEKKLNITEEKINEILKTKKDNLDKISRDMDDKKLINDLKEEVTKYLQERISKSRMRVGKNGIC